MANRMWTAVLLLCPLVATAQDLRTSRLEQEVRQLQREVLGLSQLVSQMRARIEAPGPVAPSAPALPRAGQPTVDVTPGPVPPQWVDATRWQRLRTGMPELEVLGELGPPSSMRVEGDERVLLYALEIGRSGFLAGSIRLRDRRVSAVETPVLK